MGYPLPCSALQQGVDFKPIAGQIRETNCLQFTASGKLKITCQTDSGH